MMPVLTVALALLSNAGDLARILVAPEAAPPPITMYFQNRHEEASFALLDENGFVRPDAIKQISHFVRCWRTHREKSMHPRLLEIVANISRHFGDAKVEVISGYRARPYGAPHSKHFLGRAMDLHIPGVPAKQVAAWVWENFRNVGVGFYPKQEFVHVDVRDQDIRWVDTSKHGESAHARYSTRTGVDSLPMDAPRLTYDFPRPIPVRAGDRLEGRQALAYVQTILDEQGPALP